MFRINKRIIIISIMLIVFVLVLSNLVNAAAQCEVDKIKQALRKMLYMFYTNPNSAPFSLTEVKDLLIFYLSIDPNAVTIDCSVLGSESNKAIFDIVEQGKNISDDIPKCIDGTQYGQCSGNRPKYCYAGAIYEKCETCGCPSNSFCGKSGKCESTSQNITCYKDLDCGTNQFIGNYYCSYDSVYKNMINYTCVSPGTPNSRCAAVNGSVWLAYCDPTLNQVCADGQSTCQTNVADAAPTVAITVNPTAVAHGQVFNVTVTGTDDVGLSAIWWWAVDSTDTELNKAHWHSCYNAKYCSNSWLVSTNAIGTIKLGANSRDTSYPIAGEPHQASEGAGIAYATITVSGTTNVSNVSGGLPDLIISDFKSYTGTTNTYVTISATIKNIGGSVTVGNLCDSLYVESLNARGFCGAILGPGESRIIQSDYALPMPGTYKIRADTDYGLLVAEWNENNNVAWQTITVTSPYSADYVKANTDLTVTDIDVQLPTTSTGQTNIYVTTKNLGSLATGQYWVLTKVTNVDTGKITNVQRLAPVVQPGGTYSTHHGSVGIIEYGTYKVEAWVDHYSYIAESDENNNYLSKTVVYGTTNVTTTSPSNIRAGWGITNDNTKKSSLFFYAINFNYADPVPSAFRVYLKKPGESTFSLAAEFMDLSKPCGTIVPLTSGWIIYRRCSPIDSWKIDSSLLPTTSYPLGAYRFYLAAADASGKESASPEFEMYNLQPLTVQSPTSAQSPVVGNPTFQWSVSSGWPISTPSYSVSIYDDANFGEHLAVHRTSVNAPTSSTTASYVYDGPALDPAKKYVARIYGLYRAATTTICPSCDYISMDASTQTFWVLNQTATCSWTADGVCPSGCAVGSDADCCTQAGKYVLIANLTDVCQQACYSNGYTAGTTPCLGCSGTSDGACPNWCAAGSDADCCSNAGKCWRPGEGCYDTCANATNQTKTINVISPNGNENWHVNNTYNIQWASQNLPSGNNIGVQLMRGLAIEQILFVQLPNSQTNVAWTVPFNIPYNVVPSQYKIRVTYIPSSGIIEAQDTSDAAFNIVYP